jgi:hypothetical protein
MYMGSAISSMTAEIARRVMACDDCQGIKRDLANFADNVKRYVEELREHVDSM